MTVLVVLSFSFYFCKYDDRVAMFCVRVSSCTGEFCSSARLPVFYRVHDDQIVFVNKLPGNCNRQVMGVDVKKEGRTDP